MDSSTSALPSIGDLSAEFAKQKRAKSPPLAFDRTPNDALAPLTSPSPSRTARVDLTSPRSGSAVMGRLGLGEAGEQQDLQVVLDQQASAIQLLHDAFAAERQAWSLEREGLYSRIGRLEGLVRRGEGYR